MAGDVHRRHVAHGARAGDARLLGRQPVHHASRSRSSASTKRRTRTVSDFGQLSAASGESRAARLSICEKAATTRSIIRPSDPAKAPPRMDMEMAGWEHRGGKAAVRAAVRRAAKARSTAIRSPSPSRCRRRTDCRIAVRRDAPKKARDFDPAKEQHTGCVLGIGLCAYRDARRRRRLPGPAGRRRGDQLSHGRQAAEGAQREVHDRRFLRKQDERIRLELRVRADPRSCRSCAA